MIQDRENGPNNELVPAQPLIDAETESIFKNLFGMGFPGFVKRD